MVTTGKTMFYDEEKSDLDTILHDQRLVLRETLDKLLFGQMNQDYFYCCYHHH
jgi:hypothetical protein